jgi:hypothetical protein
MVNQTRDVACLSRGASRRGISRSPLEGFVSRATIGSEGPLRHSDEEICPNERSEERPLFTRDDQSFRPCRKGSLSPSAHPKCSESGNQVPIFIPFQLSTFNRDHPVPVHRRLNHLIAQRC